jgi:RHS repeat-associated protein
LRSQNLRRSPQAGAVARPRGAPNPCVVSALTPNSRIGEKVDRGRFIGGRALLSAETHRGNREAMGEVSYGRFLYNRFRYYDPGIGRYVSADPIGQFGMLTEERLLIPTSPVDLTGVNVYQFAALSPLNRWDPDGLQARTPAQGQKPNSRQTFQDGKGGRTDRDYGPDGRATRDIDYGHDHSGSGDPHAHDWDWSKDKPRQDDRPLRPDEDVNAPRAPAPPPIGVPPIYGVPPSFILPLFGNPCWFFPELCPRPPGSC